MASDIDIAVKGIGDKYLMAYGYCPGLSRFNLDIRAYEDMPLKLRKRIEREGRCLYEKKKER